MGCGASTLNESSVSGGGPGGAVAGAKGEAKDVSALSPGKAFVAGESRLVFVDGNCCPASLALRMCLDWKGIPYERVGTEMGNKAPWLLRITTGSVPVLATDEYPAGSAVVKEDLVPIAGLDMVEVTLVDQVKWLDATFPDKAPKLMRPGRPQEAMPLVRAFGAAMAKCAMATAMPMQKEWKPKAVEAASALNDFLSAGPEDASWMDGETPCLADALLTAWLHRYPILVHYRSWTPETPVGQWSNVAAPSLTESRFPALARFREHGLAEAGERAASKDTLLEWAKGRVNMLPPLSIGRLEHESMRVWLKRTLALARRAAELAGSDPAAAAAAARKAALRWHLFTELVDAHSVMEDDVLYHHFDVIAPGKTDTAKHEHAEEVPKLRASVLELRRLARRLATEGGASVDDLDLYMQGPARDTSADAAPEEGAPEEAEEDEEAKEDGEGKDEDVAEQAERVVALLSELAEGMEAHMVGEEKTLFPVLKSVGPEGHKELFPNAFAAGRASRPLTFAFTLGGLNLSQAVQFWHNITSAGNCDADYISTLDRYMDIFRDSDPDILPADFAALIRDRVPVLADIHRDH